MRSSKRILPFLSVLILSLAFPVAAWAYTQADCDWNGARVSSAKTQADTSYNIVYVDRGLEPCATSVSMGQYGYTSPNDIMSYNASMSSYANSMSFGNYNYQMACYYANTGDSYYLAQNWNAAYQQYGWALSAFDDAMLAYENADVQLTSAWNSWVAHGN